MKSEYDDSLYRWNDGEWIELSPRDILQWLVDREAFSYETIRQHMAGEGLRAASEAPVTFRGLLQRGYEAALEASNE